MIFAAAFAFAIAILMLLFGWSSAHVTWELFMLIGLLCMALSGWTWGWLPRRRESQPPRQP
jgi:hypothetical protein